MRLFWTLMSYDILLTFEIIDVKIGIFRVFLHEILIKVSQIRHNLCNRVRVSRQGKSELVENRDDNIYCCKRGKIVKSSENCVFFLCCHVVIPSKNCFDRIAFCSCTGKILVSQCNWSIGVIFTHPVMVLGAAFWLVWSFCQFVWWELESNMVPYNARCFCPAYWLLLVGLC